MSKLQTMHSVYESKNDSHWQEEITASKGYVKSSGKHSMVLRVRRRLTRQLSTQPTTLWHFSITRSCLYQYMCLQLQRPCLKFHSKWCQCWLNGLLSQLTKLTSSLARCQTRHVSWTRSLRGWWRTFTDFWVKKGHAKPLNCSKLTVTEVRC